MGYITRYAGVLGLSLAGCLAQAELPPRAATAGPRLLSSAPSLLAESRRIGQGRADAAPELGAADPAEQDVPAAAGSGPTPVTIYNTMIGGAQREGGCCACAGGCPGDAACGGALAPYLWQRERLGWSYRQAHSGFHYNGFFGAFRYQGPAYFSPPQRQIHWSLPLLWGRPAGPKGPNRIVR